MRSASTTFRFRCTVRRRSGSSCATSKRSARSGRCRPTSSATRSRCARSCTAPNARSPWVRDELERLATEYVGAYEVQPDALQEQLGDLDLTDPSSMASLTQLGDPSALLGAMRSDRQGPLLESLQRFVSVLEGYTDIVVETLGEPMITVARAHRRGAEASSPRPRRGGRVRRPPARPRARPRPLRRRRRVQPRRRRAGRDRTAQPACGPSPEMIPTRAEFEAPGLWLARIDL